ncbi:hypothetical protein CJ030_MR6G025957 [Morella rubra]|uniref:Uncharacterized protein n=1 Tax=Morella rubra TaxID=262757 RepID=A0A6A1V8P6_9ROSI|nr:hypothetical protein CJ030_MR6G025957 [Morella rubra]
MANSLFVTPNCSFKSPNKPGIVIGNSVTRKVIRVNEVSQKSQTPRFQSLEAKDNISIISAYKAEGITANKATESNQNPTKPNSIVCASCDGNEVKGRFCVGVVTELGLSVAS